MFSTNIKRNALLKLVSLMAACLGSHTIVSAQTVFNLDFDFAYFLPSDVAGAGFTPGETTTVVAGGSGASMNRMPLWDIGDVSFEQRQAGTGDFNSVVSDIDWNTTAGNPNPIDGNTTADTTPNYRGIAVNDFWRGLGIQITTIDTLSIMDSHDYFLNDGVAGDVGNIRNGAGGPGGDGDTDNLTGNDPAVSAVKDNASATNNTAPNAINMGNLLINEENPGDGIPDDQAGGDVKTFEIDDEGAYVVDGNGDPFSVQARLDRFVFVDDVDASILIALKNPNDLDDSANVILTSAEIGAFAFNLSEDNEIFEVDVAAEIATYYAGLSNPAFDYNLAFIDYWEVDYNSSGGLGEAQFSFFNNAPPAVPEPSNVVGAGALIGLISLRMLKRRRRSGSVQS